MPWNPIAPEAYDSTINSVDVCFLTRITESDFSPFGMAFSEVEQVKTNIINKLPAILLLQTFCQVISGKDIRF